jgi:hypothetical protein
MEELDLSYFFKTKDEALDFSTHLAIVSDKIFETGFNLEKVLSEQFGIQKKNQLINLMTKEGVSEQSQSALKEFINKVQNKITNLPTISMTIAFIPREKTLQVLSEWFMLNHKQVLFDIKTDSNILAGATIFVNGRYMDFSLKPKFLQVLSGIINKQEQPNGHTEISQQKQSQTIQQQTVSN